MFMHKANIILVPLIAGILLCSCSRKETETTTGQTAGEQTVSASDKIAGVDVSSEDITYLTGQELERIGDFINQDSSYGFLLSFYDSVQDADLCSIFYKIGSAASEDEKKAYLEAVGRDQLQGSLIKITQEQADQILKERTGLGSSDFSEYAGWTYLDQEKAYFFEMESSQRPYFEVLDGYENDGKLIVHCRRDSYQDVSAQYSMEGNTEETAAATESASVSDTGTEVAAQEEPGDSGSTETGWHRDVLEVTITRTAPFTPDESQMAGTSATADTAQEAAPAAEPGSEQGENYGFRPEDYGNAYQFVSNALYIQSGMLAQYSGTFAMDPLGDVDFVTYGTDSSSPAGSDATFEIVRDGEVLQVLPGMTGNNIRDGLTFGGIDSVDVEDFDRDGYTDIAVICTYKKDAGGSSTQARLYRGSERGTFSLDTDTTGKLNEDVKDLTYSGVSAYLRGKSDGSAKTYDSWKAAYADRLSMLNADLWEGAELIYVNEDRTPELLVYGKEDAQGVLLMTYNDGSVHDLHRLRRGVSWLESENVLLDSSSFMDRHYDVVYSMSDGILTATTTGTYGSSYGQNPVKDADGNPEYEYNWDGADLSRDGYREAMMFSFDFYREKSVSAKDLSAVNDLIED